MLRFRAAVLFLCLLCFAACTPPSSGVIVVMPTRAELPSATLLPTETPNATASATPNATPTLDLVETQMAELQATNAAAQVTLAALTTRMATTDTPEMTVTPSLTITNTLAAGTVTPQAVPMQPRLIYAQRAANLRPCPNQSCAPVAQLVTGEAVMATGTIQGEAITSGNPHWFRVDYGGRELYVYSELINVVPPPTAVPFVPSTGGEAVTSEPPYSLPPSGSAGCPNLSATCSQLTCDQAYACLAAGNRSLDRDGDGIPCESVCA